MRTRSLLVLSTVALLGWAGLVWKLFEEYDRPHDDGARLEQYEEAQHEHATEEGPPVIKLAELPAVGFDSAMLARIEPHFHVLNAALVTLVELNERFEHSKSSENEVFLASAVTFHQTAQRHERMIEAILDDRLRTAFHKYLLSREAAAGLQPDPAQHVHPSAESRNGARPTLSTNPNAKPR
jgi:hypothetical protein